MTANLIIADHYGKQILAEIREPEQVNGDFRYYTGYRWMRSRKTFSNTGFTLTSQRIIRTATDDDCKKYGYER